MRARVTLACPVCGVSFTRKPVEIRETNCCSIACSAKITGNLRPPGKGIRRSPATEFKPGHQGNQRLPVGAVTHRKHRGVVRAWVKIAEPSKWRLRAVVNWEREHGPLPPGYIVHHHNRDPLDDRIDNLTALTRAEHLAEHRAEFVGQRVSPNRAAAATT